MKKIALTILLFLCICQAFAQNFSGCLEIDFEDIPGGPYQEGSLINDQYLADFGITFSLENGFSPRLADVGGAETAFNSAWGSDTPAPGQDIGNFFLTDDGFLAGLNMIPVIVTFVEPVDSFSACILDIDFSEFFIIDAFDELGNIILSDTIRDGDPDTGDGIATCWGFNFDGCEGSVYSVRFEGSRVLPGGFGLGMDNFSFCFAGTDIANNVAIDIEDPTCEEERGTINITNLSNRPLLYSLDGVNFQESPVFEDLLFGSYSIFIQDTSGCEAEFINVTIDEFVPLEINAVVGFGTSCGEENGSVSILSTPSEGVRYSLDGINFQEESLFDSLAAGDYQVYILDAESCLYTDETSVAPSTPPIFESLTPIIDVCNNGTGQIVVNGSGGSGELTYILDDQINSTSGVFDSLTAGEYTLVMTDEAGCILDTTTTVEMGPVLLIEEVITEDPTCEDTSGGIQITASGGTGSLVYSMEGGSTSIDGNYTGLLAGTYNLSVTDGAGCTTTTQASLGIPVCPLFIPNAFSPNDDGVNDEFILFTNSNYDVRVLKCTVFDRWGELVWEAEDFTLHTFSEWWDGNFRSRPASQGVYVYMAEVQYSNGLVELLTGDVTLVR